MLWISLIVIRFALQLWEFILDITREPLRTFVSPSLVYQALKQAYPSNYHLGLVNVYVIHMFQNIP
jgi:hypothetical protein